LRQHLAAVLAARDIGGADALDVGLGATELEFRPGRPKGGEYRFAVASAGSACLVVQTVLMPLLLADGPSVLVVEGGTHNPTAPPWEYLARVLFPLLERMGARVRGTLERHGFYPAGGGRVRVEIEPVAKLGSLVLLERGAIVSRSARVLLAHIPPHVGEREVRSLCERLTGFESRVTVVQVEDSAGPGNAVLIELECEHVTEIFAAFGERGLRAEVVAERAADQLLEYLAHDAPVGPHLADQLMLPLALAGEGAFRTCALTAHSRTNLDVIRRFLPARAEVRERAANDVVVELARG
jgi:RNA 3'-terminal phosphate cyclase (ATP)